MQTNQNKPKKERRSFKALLNKGWTWLKKTLKQFGTVKGILSLLISFMIFYGWIIVLFALGIIFDNQVLTGIAVAGAAFWLGPVTPFWALVITTAIFIRKRIFRDLEEDEEVKVKIVNGKKAFVLEVRK